MKLGVGYIVFTGAEFLKPSLQNIRPFAHHIVVVFENKSHAGHKVPRYLKPLLDQLVEEKLIDQLVEVDKEPTMAAAIMQGKCREKRELARKLCEEQGCSHYLIRDCDEFHDSLQFQTILSSGLCDIHDLLITQIYEYWKSPLIRAKELSALHVPFIQKIQFPLRACNKFGKRIDKGRTPIGWKDFSVLDPNEIVLHHMTACRFNKRELHRKWQGHGHLNRNFKSGNGYIESVNKLLEENETIQVDDKFGIIKYWKEEFKQLVRPCI